GRRDGGNRRGNLCFLRGGPAWQIQKTREEEPQGKGQGDQAAELEPIQRTGGHLEVLGELLCKDTLVIWVAGEPRSGGRGSGEGWPSPTNPSLPQSVSVLPSTIAQSYFFPSSTIS